MAADRLDGSADGGREVVAAKVRIPPADSLRRDRLHAVLSTAWRHRLGVVVAPAGSGKTTLLADFALDAGVPVAWYRAETWDAAEVDLLRHLEAAVAAAVPGVAGAWRSVEEAAAALERLETERLLLVVDDGHALEATPAEQALERFIEYAPRSLAVLIGTRVPPGFNLSRLRVSGDLLEIGPDDLRFRAWEVERLFRDYYGDPVPPGELAVLARRTEGWAAGLQLFHLATRGRSAEERRRILSGAGTSSRLVREYLTWNVMASLPDELRDFLVDTCVLGRLSGDLCDRLLGRRESAALLEELFRRQIFTVEVDEADGTYRYHEVLRSHLDRTLVARVGETAARERYSRAGALLEAAGAHAEALAAYARAEDWAAARLLLGGHGQQLADDASRWLETLPAAVVRHEPWLELASARRARAEGRWTDALEAYGRAESAFGPSLISITCHDERLSLRGWLDPVAAMPTDWTRALRAGLVREPLRVPTETAAGGPPPSFVRGLLALAAGKVTEAREYLAASRQHLEDRPELGAVALLGEGIAASLALEPDGPVLIEDAVDAAERAGLSWLARIARSASRVGGAPGGAPDAEAAEAGFDRARDPWGAAIAALFHGWDATVSASSRRADADAADGGAVADAAAGEFRRLGAGVLEAWARGIAALAVARQAAPDARDTAIAAESFGRAAGVPAARLLAYRALALADHNRSSEYERLAAAVADETGLAATGVPEPATRMDAEERSVPEAHSPAPALPAADGVADVSVRLFGGFQLSAGDGVVSVESIRPRARDLLRLLAVHAGRSVHREVLIEALWPGVDAASAARSLQVAVSAVRGLLAEALGAAGPRLVARDGDAYRLAVPDEAVDVRRFDLAVAAGHSARARGDSAIGHFREALSLYTGDLLPEGGPEDWIVEVRDRYRARAVEVAATVAELALAGGDVRAAIDACRVGLGIDRYYDPLWRLLIEARRRAGDVGAAHRDQQEYEAVLVELGLPDRVAVSAP